MTECMSKEKEYMMNARILARCGALFGALAAIPLTAGVLLAQASPTPSQPAAPQQVTHDQMHQMMDAMHGDGTSDRMHQVMGAEADAMIDQCAMMMSMMSGMGMMGGQPTAPMPGMTGR